MTLLAAAFAVSICIVVSAAQPWRLRAVRTQSKRLATLGAIVLLGFIVCEVLPGVVAMGRFAAASLTAASYAFFAALRTFAFDDQDASCPQCPRSGLAELVGSMSLHALAGGLLLGVASTTPESFTVTLFASLAAHKLFEALAASTLIFDRARSKMGFDASLALYAFSLPIGTAAAILSMRIAPTIFDVETISYIAMGLTSFAIGGIICSLVHDFLIPQLHLGDAARPRKWDKLQSAGTDSSSH